MEKMSKTQYLRAAVLILVGMLVWMLSCVGVAGAFDFHADTAHGNNSYGVNRSTAECENWPGGVCTTGSCAHCHDTFHPDICGVNDLMFFAPYGSGSQTENFCFECHKGEGSFQDPLFTNYNYSYRASGDTSIACPDNILEAFSFINEEGISVLNCDSNYGTSHKLSDITAFISSPERDWGYTADSNPCTACHNPHPAQRDAHTSGNRGWLVALPSGHADTPTWQLWGDDPNKKMNKYTTYQAPNAVSESRFEPDGSTTQDGSNLTDYVTFCTDCHNSSNTIYSTVLGRNLYTINWNGENSEKHGTGEASDCCSHILSPYSTPQCGNYILACTDCHEPHGAPNIFLTRQKVNNGSVTVTTGEEAGPGGMQSREWVYLCGKCHDGLLTNDGHVHPSHLPWDPPESCSSGPCHFWNLPSGKTVTYRPCAHCHYHGNSLIDGNDYGEPLF